MSSRKHSLWLHYGISAGIVLLALLTVAWYATDRFHEFFVSHLQGTLQSRAIIVDQEITASGMQSACLILKRSDPSLRVTTVNAQGQVLCDSEVESSLMENHANRPEIQQAFAGQTGSSTRFSDTLKTSMLYLAIPRFESGAVVTVIRTAIPLLSIEGLLTELYQQFSVLLIVLLGVVGLVILNIYRKINQPLAEIIEDANCFAKGDFSATLPEYDIREIAELGTALNTMARQLSRLENLRQDFVANVSHELKTPISTIKGYVETLLDGAMNEPDDLHHFLKIVLKQNDRLADIVDDLLTLSRLETAPLNQLLALNENNVEDLLRSSAEICLARAQAKNIKLKVLCTDVLLVQVDYSLMTQALVNLLDNAIKYSFESTEITLSAKRQGKSIEISICDQGPGIPPEHIPRLFERFYRIDKSRSRRIGGTGLGLAIVKHIVHTHSGAIEVLNNGGAGCCFKIKMPEFH